MCLFIFLSSLPVLSEPYSSTSITQVYVDNLSVFFFFLKEKHNFYLLPDGYFGCKIKIPKYLADHLVPLVGFCWLSSCVLISSLSRGNLTPLDFYFKKKLFIFCPIVNFPFRTFTESIGGRWYLSYLCAGAFPDWLVIGCPEQAWWGWRIRLCAWDITFSRRWRLVRMGIGFPWIHWHWAWS